MPRSPTLDDNQGESDNNAVEGGSSAVLTSDESARPQRCSFIPKIPIHESGLARDGDKDRHGEGSSSSKDNPDDDRI